MTATQEDGLAKPSGLSALQVALAFFGIMGLVLTVLVAIGVFLTARESRGDANFYRMTQGVAHSPLTCVVVSGYNVRHTEFRDRRVLTLFSRALLKTSDDTGMNAGNSAGFYLTLHFADGTRASTHLHFYTDSNKWLTQIPGQSENWAASLDEDRWQIVIRGNSELRSILEKTLQVPGGSLVPQG